MITLIIAICLFIGMFALAFAIGAFCSAGLGERDQ